MSQTSLFNDPKDTTLDAKMALTSLRAQGVDDSTIKKFFDYHRTHRWLWDEFQSCALKILASGQERIGGKEVFEMIRRNSQRETNNNWAAYYVRVFCAKYPGFASRFERRQLSGVRQ